MKQKLTRQQRHDQKVARVKREFEKHEISKQSDGRWLLQKRRSDGTFDWTMATEVVCLEGGRLYVGGDTFPVIFGYCSDPPIARVRWLGAHSDIEYYVAQKASIGLGSSALVEEYDPDTALFDLDQLVEEYTEYKDGQCVPDEPMVLSIMEAHDVVHDGHMALLGFLRDAAEKHGEYSFMEDRHSFGIVTSSRVYCAWAALARLVELIKEAEDGERRRVGATV